MTGQSVWKLLVPVESWCGSTCMTERAVCAWLETCLGHQMRNLHCL